MVNLITTNLQLQKKKKNMEIFKKCKVNGELILQH